jgi:hypothetical protein
MIPGIKAERKACGDCDGVEERGGALTGRRDGRGVRIGFGDVGQFIGMRREKVSLSRKRLRDVM